MKYATKFMMVPYVKPISGGPEDKPTELSNRMSTTLATVDNYKDWKRNSKRSSNGAALYTFSMTMPNHMLLWLPSGHSNA